MALLAENGTFTCRTTVGTKAVALSTFGGATPTAVICWTSALTTNSFSENVLGGFGLAVSATSRACIAWSSPNGLGTSDTDRRFSDDHLLSWMNSSSVLVEFDLDSFSADTFTVDFVTVDGTAHDIHFLAFGGDDLTDVDLEQITSPTTTGQVEYSNFAFQPDSLIAFTNGTSSATSPKTDANLIASIGFTDGTTTHCSGIGSENGQSQSDTYKVQTTNLIHAPHNNAAFLVASLVSLDNDGYTLDWTTVQGTGRKVFVLGLRGGQHKVTTDTQKTDATGVKSTSIGFAGKGCLLTSCNAVNSASIDSGLKLTIGAVDSSSNDSCCAWADEDAQTTTDSDRFQNKAHALAFIDHAQAQDARASGSFVGNNLDLDWVLQDATAREWGGIFFGDDAAAATLPKNHALIGVGI